MLGCPAIRRYYGTIRIVTLGILVCAGVLYPRVIHRYLGTRAYWCVLGWTFGWHFVYTMGHFEKGSYVHLYIVMALLDMDDLMCLQSRLTIDYGLATVYSG